MLPPFQSDDNGAVTVDASVDSFVAAVIVIAVARSDNSEILPANDSIRLDMTDDARAVILLNLRLCPFVLCVVGARVLVEVSFSSDWVSVSLLLSLSLSRDFTVTLCVIGLCDRSDIIIVTIAVTPY